MKDWVKGQSGSKKPTQLAPKGADKGDPGAFIVPESMKEEVEKLLTEGIPRPKFLHSAVEDNADRAVRDLEKALEKKGQIEILPGREMEEMSPTIDRLEVALDEIASEYSGDDCYVNALIAAAGEALGALKQALTTSG